MELQQLCAFVLLCQLVTSPCRTASTENVTMDDSSGSSGMDIYSGMEFYSSNDMPSPTSSTEFLLLPLDSNTISTYMLSPTSTISSNDTPSATNILYSSNIAMGSFFPSETGVPTHTTAELAPSSETRVPTHTTAELAPSSETGVPTHTTAELAPSSETGTSATEIEISESPFPTETGMQNPTTTDLPTSPEIETSTTEIVTTEMSDTTLPLSIALGIVFSLFMLLVLCIICVVICKHSARRKSGKPRKQPLYVVEVAKKEISDLELEAADLFQSDSIILSGKSSDEPTCETFHAHLGATEAKENKQKSSQKEEMEFITLETFAVGQDLQNSNTSNV